MAELIDDLYVQRLLDSSPLHDTFRRTLRQMGLDENGDPLPVTDIEPRQIMRIESPVQLPDMTVTPYGS